ncbi:MAG: leucyl aminopeptidase [Microthrixaceae bacterium]|nr:leucyl aminopeptidase [Acidimicrobiales bacterium]MCB9405062.1 leucyl aminopeptidase [Microthrixaceae bacterium]
MQIEVGSGDLATRDTGLLVALCRQDGGVPAALAELVEERDFTAAPNQTVVSYPRGAVAARRVILVGLGPDAGIDEERLRQAAATAIRAARPFGEESVVVALPADLAVTGAALGEALATGIELGDYRFTRFRTSLTEDEAFDIETVALLADPSDASAIAEGVAVGQAVANGVLMARDLVNTPGGMKTPPDLAAMAIAMGETQPSITVTVLDEVELAEQGFGGILAVGKGSDSPPRFIIAEYGADLEGVPTVCLVGKGLTFDSGGLNIKPADGMLWMKNDMGGSAAVFGTLRVVAELGLPIHLVGLVPSAENMPSGRSYRPGDIVTTLSGTTVEIHNTDAEGRVILSDGLFYARRYEPDAIIELSTLTGAIIIALANHASGLMATDQALADALLAAGTRSGDRAWQLPLWDEYREMVKAENADLKNLAGPAGGSITAGAFLAHFAGDFPFAHLDIAGTAWIDAPKSPYLSSGGTGAGVRMVTRYLRDLVG